MAKKRRSKKKQASASPLPSGLLAHKSYQLVVVAGLILLTYLHTLDVPFYLDDNLSLRDNTAIQGIIGLEYPEEAMQQQ